MIKFFTPPGALLLAWAGLALALETMPAAPSNQGPAASETATRSTSGLPAALSTAHFAPLARKSPFTLASTTEESADFAKDLVLAGYFRMDGKDYVMVANRTRPERLMVGTQPSPSAQGMILLKVDRDPSGDPAKLKAQIRKGTETATLKYEAAPANPAAGPGPQGGQPVPQQGQPVAAQVPGARPPQTPPGQAAPQGQNAPQAPAVVRRRTMPIPPLPSR